MLLVRRENIPVDRGYQAWKRSNGFRHLRKLRHDEIMPLDPRTWGKLSITELDQTLPSNFGFIL